MAKKAAKGGKGLTPKQKAGLVEAALVNEGPLEFVFKLEGNLRDMSVFELAPTLQSGVALREANRALFPQSADLRVAVKRSRMARTRFTTSCRTRRRPYPF